MVTEKEVRASTIFAADLDRTEFSFNNKLSVDEITELIERNPRVSMMCDWIAGEMLKNKWKWVKDEMIDTPDGELTKDEYLEYIYFYEELHRAIMFARGHGTSLIKFFEEEGKLTKGKTYHRSISKSGWVILKEDVGADGEPFQFTLRMYPPIEDPTISPEPKVSKIKIEDCVVFKNPMKGETWGGTPSAKLIAPTAQLEELIVRLLGKHALDQVNNWYNVTNVKDNDHATEIAEVLEKPTKQALYSKDLEITPMSLSISGQNGDFAELIDILKNYMANAMRVSAQAMDGAPEGTLSSAEYNTMISYAVIEQMQNHWKPYIEDCFRRLGFQYPDIIWNKPMIKLDNPKDDNNDT